MKTTIQLADEDRDRLLAIAAARGDKSVGKVVQDAVAFYLEERSKPAPVPALALPATPPGRLEQLGARLDRSWREPPAGLLGTVIGMLRARLARA